MQATNPALQTLLLRASHNSIYLLALQNGLSQYQIKPFNIMKLSPPNILQIYRHIASKFYFSETIDQIDCWYQNELRIFVWMLIIYVYLEHKMVSDMNQEDWKYFSSILNGKDPDTLQFQSLCLNKKRKTVRWNSQQTELLIEIIKDKEQKNRWNQIAKKMFLLSNKKYFRTPKQCRQQWINHLDPTKTRQKWTTLQDYEMIKGIIQHGRRWSKVAKHLGGIRTQHMVKNRYKSLIKSEIKRLDYEENQQILVAKIRQRLQSSIIIKRYNKNHQNTRKLKQIKKQQKIIFKKQLNQNSQQTQKYHQQKVISSGMPTTPHIPDSSIKFHNHKEQQKPYKQQQGEGDQWEWDQEPLIDGLNQYPNEFICNKRIQLDCPEVNYFFQESPLCSL